LSAVMDDVIHEERPEDEAARLREDHVVAKFERPGNTERLLAERGDRGAALGGVGIECGEELVPVAIDLGCVGRAAGRREVDLRFGGDARAVPSEVRQMRGELAESGRFGVRFPGWVLERDALEERAGGAHLVIELGKEPFGEGHEAVVGNRARTARSAEPAGAPWRVLYLSTA